MSQVDNTVLLGVAPIMGAVSPVSLKKLGVFGVINLCDEFRGPIATYDRLGMDQLWLPTVDHFEPSVPDLHAAVDFIQKFRKRGQKVYVHCKAGHGRSAAVAYCWMLTQNPDLDPKEISRSLESKRRVRKNIHLQRNTAMFRDELLRQLKEKSATEDADQLK